MISHCKSEYPIEACGLLSGNFGMVYTLWPMVNVHQSRNSFCMDIKEIQSVFNKMDAKIEHLIGIYHSHPSSDAYPSPEDVLYHNYPDASYIIVSLAYKKPVVKAFKIRDRKVIPLTLVVR